MITRQVRDLLTSPLFLRRANGCLTVFWAVLIVPSFMFGWVNSVAYVSGLSLWALVASHWSGWQSARVEVAQDKDANVQDVIDLLTPGSIRDAS